MRRDTSQPYTNWTIRVTREDKASFRKLFPMRGATSWFVEETIRRVLADLKKNPGLKAFCQNQIATMLTSGSPGVTEEISLRMPTGLYQEFNDELPGWGAATWLVRSLMAAVIEVMDGDSLENHLDEAVQRVLTP